MKGHVLGLDIGDVRIGIAVSDETRLIASPLEVYTRVGWGPDSRHILGLCQQYHTTEVVSGLPLNMDGSAGFQAQKVRDFCKQLEKAGLTVYYQDERLTTVTAEGALLEEGMHRRERKQHVDKVAASVILQIWLDSAGHQPPEGETPMSENNEQSDVLELLDDEGNTVAFEHLATLLHDGQYYLALTPADVDEDEEDIPVVFMEIGEDENGDEFYAALEDEELEAQLFEELVALSEEQEDEEE